MRVEDFSAFLARVAAAQPNQYSDAIAAAAEHQGLSVHDVTAEFERMKNYVLSYYSGVAPVHSFVNTGGQVIDCVPSDQLQATRAARDAGFDLQSPAPPPTPLSGTGPATDPSVPPGPRPGTASPPGGPTSPRSTPDASMDEQPPQIPPGTVPLPRITLERLISAGGIDRFFRKQTGPPAPDVPSPPPGTPR